ncbi:hypothetical protein SAMN05192559_11289 [Halobacillus karajensis]|uniref:hypothetical protein n=1 Tax=Halobacillus karajensis TaxID=195088 RepID=UPI0008A80A7F|nr:hypothetical protein SAMN05192559_11289 [Halobacillus karajensis]
MIDAGWLNVGSLILGLVAWIISIINHAGDKKQKNMKWIALSIISFSACAIAICLQIFYNLHLVKIGDWVALGDNAWCSCCFNSTCHCYHFIKCTYVVFKSG